MQSAPNSTTLREKGLEDERNKSLMSKGYPPGPPQAIAKKLNLRDINTYMKLHEEFGDTYMLPLGEVPLVVTRDPALIRYLLGGDGTETFPRPVNVIANIKILFNRAQIALDGEEHQANKRMLSRFLFSDAHNAMMAAPLQEIASDFLYRLEEDYYENNGAEAYAIAELAAADISSALSMGRTYKALQTGQCPQLDALKICDKIFLNRAMNKRWKETEPKEVTEQFNSNRQLIADTFMDAFKRLSGGDSSVNHNILNHMIDNNLFNRSEKCPMGQVPTVDEAISNMIGFLAGVGNTARMMTLGIEMAVQHPECQVKILEELHRVLDGKSPEAAKKAAQEGLAVPGAKIKELYSYDKVMQLHYLRVFLMECLRLYTPSTSVAPRAAADNYPLGEFMIPKETKVMANIYGAHRHPSLWADPLKFDPMRFNINGNNEPIIPKPVVEEGFFPFGYGGHSCIGKNIAMECTLMTWSMLFANFRVYRTPGFGNADFNTLKSDQILGFIEAQNGVHVNLEKRKRDPELEKLAPRRILNEHSAKNAEYQKRLKAEEEEYAKSLNVDKDRLITMDELKKHTTRETGVWILIDGVVYDVTSWLKDHPGGADSLLRSAGKDASKVFELTNHSSFAKAEALKYKIGRIQPQSNL